MAQRDEVPGVAVRFGLVIAERIFLGDEVDDAITFAAFDDGDIDTVHKPPCSTLAMTFSM